MRTTRLFILMAAILPAFIHGQDKAIEDFRTINMAYHQLQSIEMDVQYNLYANWKDKNPVQIEKGTVKRKGGLYYMKLAEMEHVQNSEYSVVVDHEEKSIAVLANYGKPVIDDYSKILPEISKSLKSCRSVKYKDLPKNQFQYDLLLPKGYSEFDRVLIEVDKSTYLLSSIVLYYAKEQDLTESEKEEAPRLEMLYTNIKTNQSIATDYFTYDRFIKVVNGKLVMLEKYKKYELETTWSPKS